MITAIELGTKTLTAVTVKVNGQGPEIVRSGTAPLASMDGPGVRDALVRCGMAGPRGILVVSRGHALIRDLELPDGTPEELVAMVRFQVEKEMPFPLNEVRYSFIENGREGGKVRIQVVAVQRDLLDPAIAAVEGAGMKVAGVYVSSFGLLTLCPAGESAALVEVGGGEAEILVADGGRMEFSRTAPFEDGASGEALAQEIRGSLLSYAARAPGKEVRRVVLAGRGEAADALAADVGRRLDREIQQAGPGDLETAPLAGLCTGLLRGILMPDLLHPPVAVKKYRPTRLHRIGALAGVVVLMLGIWSQVALSDKRARLEEKRQELKTLEPRAAQVTKLLQQTQLAHQWYRDRNVWVDVLGALRQSVNPANLWLVNASFEDPGVIRLQGKAKDDSHVTALVTALKKSDKFRDVQIEKIDTSRTDKSDYKKDFAVIAHLAGYDPKRKK